MTRKDELQQLAHDTTERLLAENVCLSEGECQIVDRVIFDVLKQSEREVLFETIREALQLLYDCQNGCPLPKYETDWTRAMELAAHALKEVPG